MKHLFRIVAFLALSILSHSPSWSQLEILHDFEGMDFDHTPRSIVSSGDSVYVLTQGGGDQGKGALFRINHNGEGMITIKSFDDEASLPWHMAGNDTVLYGTTRQSAAGSGKLFRYRFSTGSFEFLKEFTTAEGQNISIKYLTDSLIWGYSDNSIEDEGNIFTINYDGSAFTKIYNNTSSNTGMNPTDICIVENEIFATFLNGGGIPYPDGTGSTVASGSVAKMDIDGNNFTTIIQGEDMVGTGPRSLVNHGGRLIGYFTGAGSDNGGKLFSVGYDGNEFETLVDIGQIGRGQLIAVNDSIFGITSEGLFGYEATSGEDTVLTSFTVELGRDATAGPAFGNNAFFIGTNVGGQDGGGSLLKFRKNKIPDVVNPVDTQLLQQGFVSSDIEVGNVFNDADGDDLTLTAAVPNGGVVTVSLAGTVLTITEVALGEVTVTLTADDSREGIATHTFEVLVNGPPTVQNALPNITLEEGFSTHAIDLATTFSDPNGDDLTFSAQSSDESIATVAVDGSTLTISETKLGTVTITVEADDGKQGSASDEFSVEISEVTAVNKEIDDRITIYPNPATKQITITQPGNIPFARVDIFTTSGSLLFSEPIPKSAHRMGLSLNPGLYIMRLVGEGAKVRKLVVR